jgi:hypothetical protein
LLLSSLWCQVWNRCFPLHYRTHLTSYNKQRKSYGFTTILCQYHCSQTIFNTACSRWSLSN